MSIKTPIYFENKNINESGMSEHLQDALDEIKNMSMVNYNTI